MARQVAPASQQIIKPQSKSHFQRAVVIPPPILVDWDDERKGAGEPRRISSKHRSFAQPFAYEREIEMLQIPQPAMDEFCRTAGRTGGEISLFDERDAQAARRGV